MEAALGNLERTGRVRELLRLAEAWAALAEPTTAVRLVWARALLSLRLVDRAWAQLRVLTDAGQGGVEPFVLLGRMYLDRGWPDQARKLLDKALAAYPAHPDLDRLWARLGERVTPPDGDGDGQPFDQALHLAERHLAWNNLTRARAILERLKRAQPQNARVADLLWAMEGDFRAPEEVGAMVARYAGDPLTTLADLPDDPEHTDRTESVSPEELAANLGQDDSRAFPQLFRNIEPMTEAVPPRVSEREVTAVTSLDALQSAGPAAPADWTTRADDTQIVRVVSKAATPMQPSWASDLDTDEAPTKVVASASFDLAAIRREAALLPASDLDGPEGEDEGVVQVRHHAPAPSERETVPVAPERKDLPDEGAAWARGGVRPSAVPTPVQPPPRPAAPTPAPTREIQWWLFPFAGIATMIVLVVLLVGVAQVILGLIL